MAQRELIEEYMKLPYRFDLVKDPDGNNYEVRYPELPGCAAIGDTTESALQNARYALRKWLNTSIEEGKEIPLPETSILGFEKA